MADTIAAITGCDKAHAAALLEAAGGSAELAISLFFDQGSAPLPADADAGAPRGDVGDMVVGAGPPTAAADLGRERPAWEVAVWPDGACVPEAWRQQVCVGFMFVVHGCVCAYMNMVFFVCKCACVCTRRCVYVCMCVCVYVCMCVCAKPSLAHSDRTSRRDWNCPPIPRRRLGCCSTATGPVACWRRFRPCCTSSQRLCPPPPGSPIT